MSMHPNVILMVVMEPTEDADAEKLLRQLQRDYPSKYFHPDEEESDESEDEESEDEEDDEGASAELGIGGEEYTLLVMEDDYDEGYQIAAGEGNLVLFDMVTYGYGEVITWADLEAKKQVLDAWAQEVIAKHGGTYEIQITANYW